MKVLVIAPYAPMRDGIANYAVQSVAHLRRTGHDVEVLSPSPSAAHHDLPLDTPQSVLQLTGILARYDAAVMHFHPALFLPRSGGGLGRVAMAVAVRHVLQSSRRLEILVHEADYITGSGGGPLARATRAMWQAAPALLVHSTQERDDLVKAFGIQPTRIRIVAHGVAFARRTSADRSTARASLGVDPYETLFLSIGFLQRHKGFDRSIRAFRGLADHGCRLAIVGGTRIEDPAILSYVEELGALAAETAGVDLRREFVSDEEFDRWLVAADVVVLPYREIWSSSVAERALLFERPIIASRVGGLQSQLADQPLATLVEDDAQLRAAMWEIAGVATAPVAPAPWPGELSDRAAVMAEIRVRAAAHRTRVTPVGPKARPGATRVEATGVSLSAPLRRLPLLAPPSTASANPGWSQVKRIVLKLTYWEVKDLIRQVNLLQQTMIELVESGYSAATQPGPASSAAVEDLRRPLAVEAAGLGEDPQGPVDPALGVMGSGEVPRGQADGLNARSAPTSSRPDATHE